MTLDASGNLGLGVTPSYRLEVANTSAAAYVSSAVTNISATGYTQQIFNVGAAGANGQATISYAPSLFFAIGTTANDTTTPIVFRNNNATERLRINVNGEIGIGGANYGTAGQVLTSGGTGAAPTWTTKAASGANTDITSLAATTTINSYVIGYRDVPQNAQNGNYTLVLGDASKHIYSANSGAQTLTVPTNASVAFPVGTTITNINNGTTNITYTTTSLTVYKAGTSAAWASGGTLAPRGLATWIKVATDTWFVSGSGLS
jgi:hypothetical protein